MARKRHQPQIGETVAIPITDNYIALAVIAHTSQDGYAIFTLGFDKLFSSGANHAELLHHAQTASPELAISTSPAFLDNGKWFVVGTVDRTDYSDYFPAYKKHRHLHKDWVIEDYTRAFQRMATKEEETVLPLRNSSTPGVLTALISVDNGLQEPLARKRENHVGKYPLARDYFENYDPPLAQ